MPRLLSADIDTHELP